ncbi:MAG TPA: hypothetical protein VF592_04800 [Sphingomonas sp.]|jgi:hypothetical protein|uniref:hypothetical protein n=1 Tax=Sphingomonas sp. TaxID=28214 RepID=UPI002ED79F2B
MSDKQPQQAMPSDGRKGAPDGVSTAPSGKDAAGESGGGAYPNPQTGKEPEGGGFMGHGGQTKVAYHGTGQGGTDVDADVGNANAVTKQD